ncbi:collagen alpha-1(XXIV) chain-like [Oenanthe melanoleuca]|uniref:collagen alpha-1(XXIV) chain-like n=1 Tax=Oenanthe melanoleuca TaxID=2939378 RepID=UPI0024C12FE2|nr:collagen alpha-1(XXIV) chain-like [Oenanthe melanoleuca]
MAANSAVSREQMDFWGGMMFMRNSVTPTERKIVWDAVAGYIQQQLMLHKGIRIPTLGSFDVAHTETLVGNKTVSLQRPVFHLARNLGDVQNLENKDDLAGDKELEPLKYAKVAMEASVSRGKVESCILGTTSLLHHCLEKGVSVAFVLKDVGVLLIEGSTVQTRFYLDFLKKVIGKSIKDKATLKALQQLDMVVSRDVPITSLSFSGRVIVFPNFEQTLLHTLLSRDQLKDFGFVPGEDKRDITGLPPIRRSMEGTHPGLPVPARQGSTAKAGEQPGDEEVMEMRQSSGVRKLSVMPGAAAGKKEPVTDPAKGKPVPKGQELKQSDQEAAATERGRGGRGERKDSLSRDGEKKVPLGKEGERRESLGGEKAHLGRDGKKKVPLGKDGERRESTGGEGEKTPLGRDREKKVQLGKERRESLEGEKARLGRDREKVQVGKGGERRESLGRGGEKTPLGRDGENKVKLGKGGERRESLGRKGEKARLGTDGEKKVQLGKERRESLVGEKSHLGRDGENKVKLGKGERRESLGREGEKAPLGRDVEKKVQLGKGGERRESLGRKGEKARLGREGKSKDSHRREEQNTDSSRREGEKKVLRVREKEAKDAAGSEGEKKARPKTGENKVSPRRKGQKKVPLGREGAKFCLKREEVKYLLEREREKRLLCGRGGERAVPAEGTAVLWGGQGRKAPEHKVFIVQQRGAEAAQGLRARPEAFWSVLKEPQRSILAGYRFESSRLLPPLSLQGAPPVLKKREKVSRGPWPWVE